MGYAQLSHVVSGVKVYHPNYPYRPGITREILSHYNEQIKENIKSLNINRRSLVLDIGSNDGSQLLYYKKFPGLFAKDKRVHLLNLKQYYYICN